MSERMKQLLQAIFVTSIVIANITGSKLAWIPILEVAVPSGFIAIGVAFLTTDLLGELYGKQTARTTVNTGILALIVGWGLVYVSLWLPAAPFYEYNDAFTTVLGQSGFIVTASILTFLISQNLDVTIFHALKRLSDKKFVRNIGSTGISQFVDSAVFVVLAFSILPFLFGGDVLAMSVIVSLVTGQYVAKLGIVVLDTPVFYVVSWYYG